MRALPSFGDVHEPVTLPTTSPPDQIGVPSVGAVPGIVNPTHRRWVGFTMTGIAPAEGTPIWSGGEVIGNVTGSWTSPLLGKALMLGWLRRTPFPERVEIDGREAVVTSTPFYDAEGHRARA